MEKIGVFCGSSMGKEEIYRKQARLLGEEMGKRKMELIFGGSSIGLMRIIADEMLKNGQPVIGVMPHFLVKKEIAHQDITEMILVDTMNERKEKIMELSDAFIAMPGGFGTLDEITEVLTACQLNLICKPLALYNINHYFDSFVHFLDVMVAEGFLRQEHRSNIIVEETPAKLLDVLSDFQPAEIPHHWVKELIDKTNEWIHYTED